MKKIKEGRKKLSLLDENKVNTIESSESLSSHEQIKYIKEQIKGLNAQLNQLIDLKPHRKKSHLAKSNPKNIVNSFVSETADNLVPDKPFSAKEEIWVIKAQLNELQNSITEIKASLLTSQKEFLNNFNNLVSTTIERLQKEVIPQIIKANVEKMESQCTSILRNLQNENKRLERISGSVNEIVWANIFNSTLKPEDRNSSSYSPGRWAIGYPCLYAMYRILSIMKPKNILELGLGQSTVMIGDYVSKHEGVRHTVVERSPEWVEFFTEQNQLPEDTRIEVLDYDFVDYGGKEGVRIFRDFEKTVGGKKYDFVCIDAPWGFDMKDYSRIDVLRSLSADFLASSFAILVDDTNRKPETNMVNAMRAVLFGRGIATAIGKYRGDKECTVICTEDLAYLTSM